MRDRDAADEVSLKHQLKRSQLRGCGSCIKKEELWISVCTSC